MAKDLSRQIELLTAQLEEQRLQIASLSQEREDSEIVPNRTVEQLAAQLEQQRLQITLLTQAQNRSDQLETGSSRIAVMPSRALCFGASRVPDSIKLLILF